MKTLYTLLAAGSLMLAAPTASHATSRYTTDEPTEAARKATAREKVATAAKAAKDAKATKKSSHRLRKFKAGLNHSMLVLLGLEESKAVTSPAKLNRQLHIHQKHLKTKAKFEAKARRRRTIQLLG